MIDEDRYERIHKSAASKNFLSLLSLTKIGKERQLDVDYYCRAISHITQEFSEQFDVEEYVDHSIREFMIKKSARFTEVLDQIDRAAKLLVETDKNILRPYKNGSFSGRVGRVAFETIFVGVATNIDAIESLGSKSTSFIRSKATEMWKETAIKSFSGSGIRGTDRIKKTIPFGEEWFAP